MITYQLILLSSLLLTTALNHTTATAAQPENGGLYVFGDSTVDAGNNNHVVNGIKVNSLPYGIDLGRPPTGRFTNGKTIADLLGEKMGYSIVEAYHTYPEKKRKLIFEGMNFASGGCGIHHNTLPVPGLFCSSLMAQLQKFGHHIKELQLEPEERELHLKRSFFLLSIGSNDILFSYKKGNDPGLFAAKLAQSFKSKLEDLYEMGARRFLVNNIGPLGCLPSELIGVARKCNSSLNVVATVYDWHLPLMLLEFTHTHHDVSVILADSLQLISWALFNPTEKEQKELNLKDPCCADGNMDCNKQAKVCGDRNKFLFFDKAHTSEAANMIFVEACLEGSICKNFSRGGVHKLVLGNTRESTSCLCDPNCWNCYLPLFYAILAILLMSMAYIYKGKLITLFTSCFFIKNWGKEKVVHKIERKD